MEFRQLKEDMYIKDWLSGIGANPTTKENYIDSLRAYTEFLNKTPEQIITESEYYIKIDKLMRERRILHALPQTQFCLQALDIISDFCTPQSTNI